MTNRKTATNRKITVAPKSHLKIRHFRTVRAFIRKLPDQACDMEQWLVGPGNSYAIPLFEQMKANGFKCGTAGCIGGWTEALLNAKDSNSDICINEWLGITHTERESLFYTFPAFPPRDISWKQWILARLDDVIETGTIRHYRKSLVGRFKKAKA